MDSLFTTSLPTSFSSQEKHSPSLAMQGLAYDSPLLQTSNCYSLLIPNKRIFAGEITGSLFVLGQHLLHLFGFQEAANRVIIIF